MVLQRHFFPKTTCSAPSRRRGWSWISKQSSPGFPSPVWGFLPYSANSLQRSWKGLHCPGKILSQWDFYTDVISFIFRGVLPPHTTPLSRTRGDSGPDLGKSTVGTSHLPCSVCGCLFQNDTKTFQEFRRNLPHKILIFNVTPSVLHMGLCSPSLSKWFKNFLPSVMERVHHTE